MYKRQPTGDPTLPLKALIFDSIYDSYKGVIVYVRIFEGTVKPGDTIRLMSTGAEFQLCLLYTSRCV